MASHPANKGRSSSATVRGGSVPKVALLVETARSFGRQFLGGVARYARHHRPWAFCIEPGDFDQVVPRMRQWGGTGIIARIPNDRVARAILDANVPTIALGLTEEQLQAGSPLAHLPNVSSDATQVAQLAIDHFLERQVTRFAYVGVEGRAWSWRRGKAFCTRLNALGYEAHVYSPAEQPGDHKWERELAVMASWLRGLPTPLGLFTCDDDRGRQVLEACRLSHLRVPEDVAVLGVDNDAVLCDLADPPLSSIALNAETAGYRAAELLDGLMRGRVRRPRSVVVEALRVVARQSTEITSTGDGDVMAALQFIRQKRGCGVSVSDVAAEVGVPRRRLERRFRDLRSRSVLDEIQHARLERAKQLLLETVYPISKVAEMAGFGGCSYFVTFFKRQVGTTPRRFRMQLTT